MTLGQLPAETHPAWWVKEHRVHMANDGEVIYDPKLWWPMEIVKWVGMAFRLLRYSVSWRRVKLPRIERRKVRTYRKHARGLPWVRSWVVASTRDNRKVI